MRDTDDVLGLRLILAGNTVLDNVNSTIRHSGLFKSTYAIRSRVKEEATLRDKIDIKRRTGKEDYCASDITDIVGIRFISLFRSDIVKSVETVLSLVFDDSGVTPNAFSGCSLLEFISYVSAASEDAQLNTRLEDVYKRYFPEKSNVEFRPVLMARYSSVHIVVRLSTLHGGRTISVPIEMQFRSVFEDTWSEIDHGLLYEMGRYGETVDSAYRDVVAQHMTVLKRMMDTAATYADVISSTVIKSQPRLTHIPRNLDGSDYISELCAVASLRQPIRDDLIAAIRQKEQLDQAIEANSPTASASQYVPIASSLAAIIPSIQAEYSAQETPALRTVWFSARMEEALSRLLSRDEKQVRAAAALYRGITTDFSGFPGAWFRAAQAYQRLAQMVDIHSDEASSFTEDASHAFLKSLELLSALNDMRDHDKILIISDRQEDYIRENAARLRGFVTWRLSDKRRQLGAKPADVDLQAAINAYQITEPAIDALPPGPARTSLVNNAVFFANDAWTLSKDLGLDAAGLPSEKRVLELLGELESAVGDENANDVLHLDTIVRALVATGNGDRARTFATMIMDKSAEPETWGGNLDRSAYVIEARERARANAWLIIRSPPKYCSYAEMNSSFTLFSSQDA